MSPDTNRTMVEALRLTRAGRLNEATEVLQRGLASGPRAAAARPGVGPAAQATPARLRHPAGAELRVWRASGRLLPRPVARSATSPTPSAPGRAATTSTFRPVTPANPFHSWSCSTAASRTHRTSRPARG